MAIKCCVGSYSARICSTFAGFIIAQRLYKMPEADAGTAV